MQPLTLATLRGTWSTLLLPLDKAEAIQWGTIALQLEALAKAQVDGIYFNGTASEFFGQSNEEFLSLARTTADFCNERNIPFQIGASHAHAIESLRRIKQTRELNPGAFQVILPEWPPLAWGEILDFLNHLIDVAAPIPLVIYNPPNARKVLTPCEWNQLASTINGIVGIKVAGGDLTWHKEMQPVSEKMAVFVSGIRLASGTIQGCAQGSYSNLACLSPRGAKLWGSRISSNPKKALLQEAEIFAVFESALAPFREKFSSSALDKALAAAGGWAHLSSAVRWPFSSIPSSEVQRLSSLFRNELPFLFDDSGASP